MLLSQALKQGRELLNDVGVTDFALGFDRAKTRAGQCSHSRRTITLSEHFVQLNDWERVRNTVLHEAAHALAGAGAGHGYKWVIQCRNLGIDPQRCFTLETTAMPEGNVIVSCPTHGELARQHRMPKSNARTYKVCRKCRERLTYRKAYR